MSLRFRLHRYDRVVSLPVVHGAPLNDRPPSAGPRAPGFEALTRPHQDSDPEECAGDR